MPAEIWLEGRVRADLRWIDGDYSTRYRLKFETNREFTARGRSIVPYFNIEWFYDSRYDGWSRTLYQAGSEFTLDEFVRFEVYLARQDTRLPSPSDLNALGAIIKWYF